MSTLKKLISSSFIYMVGDALSKLILFLLLPLYTIYINPEDYGYVNISITFITVGISLLYMNVWNSTLRFLFDLPNEKGKVIANAGFLFVLSSILMFLVLITLFFFRIRYIQYIAIYAFILALRNVYIYISRGYKENNLFVFSGIIATIITVVINVLLIRFFKAGVVSLYISSIIAWAVQVLIIERKLKVIANFKGWKVDKTLLKGIRDLSIPLAINAVFFYFLSSYNQLAVFNILGLEEAGLFAVAGKVAIVIQLVSTAFNMAWQEFSFEKHSSEGSVLFFHKGINYFILTLGVALTILIPTISLLFPYFIKGEYVVIKGIIPIYVIAIAASVLSDFLGTIFIAIRNTKIISYSTFFAAIVNVGLCQLLIPKFGLNGASMALLGAYMVNIVFRTIFLKKHISFKINIYSVGLSVLLSIMAVFVYFLQNNYIIWIYILFISLSFSLVFRKQLFTLIFQSKWYVKQHK